MCVCVCVSVCVHVCVVCWFNNISFCYYQRVWFQIPTVNFTALEKSETHPPPKNKKSSRSDSETSYTESDSTSRRKDRTSMRPKLSQQSSDTSSVTSSSGSETDDEAVVRMSAPSTPKDGKKDHAKKDKDEFFDQKTPGTVIQFKKKDSQKVEEEVMLNERGKDHKPQAVEQEYLAGYKVRWC